MTMMVVVVMGAIDGDRGAIDVDGDDGWMVLAEITLMMLIITMVTMMMMVMITTVMNFALG